MAKDGLRTQCMISNNSINSGSLCVFVVIFLRTMYNKTIIRFGFCDILINQGLCKWYQPSWRPRLITVTLILIIPVIPKTSSNICLIVV